MGKEKGQGETYLLRHVTHTETRWPALTHEITSGPQSTSLSLSFSHRQQRSVTKAITPLEIIVCSGGCGSRSSVISWLTGAFWWSAIGVSVALVEQRCDSGSWFTYGFVLRTAQLSESSIAGFAWDREINGRMKRYFGSLWTGCVDTSAHFEIQAWPISWCTSTNTGPFHSETMLLNELACDELRSARVSANLSSLPCFLYPPTFYMPKIW